MTDSLLVTGATGSVGSNICRLAASRSIAVRALVRNLDAADPLREFGVELVEGDVTDRSALTMASRGVDRVIHAAAQIGGSWSTASEKDFESVNQQGTINLLDASEANNLHQTVVLLSMAVADRRFTVTESSPIIPISPTNSPYARTKLAAYYEGMARAARGMNVCFVLPGAIYGPTPLLERALAPTIFTSNLVSAARGEFTEYLPSPMSWVLASEVAQVSLAAAESGRSGARYLAVGRAADVCSLPTFCNRFLEMAGVSHRVSEIDPGNLGEEDKSRFGSMLKYLLESHPEPPHDASVTTAELGVTPGSLDDGLRDTLDWLRGHSRL